MMLEPYRHPGHSSNINEVINEDGDLDEDDDPRECRFAGEATYFCCRDGKVHLGLPSLPQAPPAMR